MDDNDEATLAMSWERSVNHTSIETEQTASAGGCSFHSTPSFVQRNINSDLVDGCTCLLLMQILPRFPNSVRRHDPLFLAVSYLPSAHTANLCATPTVLEILASLAVGSASCRTSADDVPCDHWASLRGLVNGALATEIFG